MESRLVEVGLVDDGLHASDAFPAAELGFAVRWQATPKRMPQAFRKRTVDKVVLQYQFEDADAAAAAAQVVQQAQPGTSTYLALTSGQALVLVQVVSVIGRNPGRSDPVEALTARELQILRMIRAGSTNRDIAKSLVISLSTVNRHVEHILLKLHVRNRTQAAVLFRVPPKGSLLSA